MDERRAEQNQVQGGVFRRQGGEIERGKILRNALCCPCPTGYTTRAQHLLGMMALGRRIIVQWSRCCQVPMMDGNEIEATR